MNVRRLTAFLRMVVSVDVLLDVALYGSIVLAGVDTPDSFEVMAYRRQIVEAVQVLSNMRPAVPMFRNGDMPALLFEPLLRTL